METKDKLVNEVVRQLPVKEVYNDLAHPILSTVGKTLQGAARVALAPVTALIWGYDKIAAYLYVALPEYFAKRKIKKESIVTPDESIAVPIIEALRYTSRKEELREMFTNLLGASMNCETYDEHPAFVEIIKQLCVDECRMLKYLRLDDKMPMIKIRTELSNNQGELDATPYFSDIGFRAQCERPQKFPEYLDNLHRLGLVEIFYDRHLTNDIFYEELRSNPYFIKMKPQDGMRSQDFEKKSMYVLSELGKKFCSVCIDD